MRTYIVLIFALYYPLQLGMSDRAISGLLTPTLQRQTHTGSSGLRTGQTGRASWSSGPPLRPKVGSGSGASVTRGRKGTLDLAILTLRPQTLRASQTPWSPLQCSQAPTPSLTRVKRGRQGRKLAKPAKASPARPASPPSRPKVAKLTP